MKHPTQPNHGYSQHRHSPYVLAKATSAPQRGPSPRVPYSPMPPQDAYTTGLQAIVHQHHNAHRCSPNAKWDLPQEDKENMPNLDIAMEGRLVTALDANISSTCDVLPILRPAFDEMHPDDKDDFRRCSPLHQCQADTIKLLNWRRANPQKAPPPEMLNALCYPIPGKDLKKRWACGMKACGKKEGDTLEHLRSHLVSKTHFHTAWFQCEICSHFFHHKHDLGRHKRNQHKPVNDSHREDSAQRSNLGPDRPPRIGKSKRTSPYQPRPSKNQANGGDIPSHNAASSHPPVSIRTAISRENPANPLPMLPTQRQATRNGDFTSRANGQNERSLNSIRTPSSSPINRSPDNDTQHVYNISSTLPPCDPVIAPIITDRNDYIPAPTIEDSPQTELEISLNRLRNPEIINQLVSQPTATDNGRQNNPQSSHREQQSRSVIPNLTPVPVAASAPVSHHSVYNVLPVNRSTQSHATSLRIRDSRQSIPMAHQNSRISPVRFRTDDRATTRGLSYCPGFEHTQVPDGKVSFSNDHGIPYSSSFGYSRY